MKAAWLTILYSSLVLLLQAQGLVFEDTQYAQLAQLAVLEGHKNIDLPTHVDLSAYCPSVRNQGDVYSCVGWAVGYGALTIKKALHHEWTDKRVIDAQAYSAMFIYNQIKAGDCGQGARITDALSFLRTQGDCLASVFDTDTEDCTIQPSKTLLARTHLDTISDYLSLFPLDATIEEKIRGVKLALAQQEPVIVGMAVRQNFYQLAGAKYWWPKLGNTTPAGGPMPLS